MRIAFYAPLKPPDHPNPSGDRRIAKLLVQALQLAGHDITLASRLRTRDASGNLLRQAKIADLGQRLAARLLGRYARSGEKPDVWLTYHLYYKAPDWIGPIMSAARPVMRRNGQEVPGTWGIGL